MTHRSPLVTLAGLVVAFALFFGINLASSAPRQATGAEYSSASPSASPADQTSETPSPSTTAAGDGDGDGDGESKWNGDSRTRG